MTISIIICAYNEEENISYACHSEKIYTQVVTAVINAVNQDYWKRSKFAFALQFSITTNLLKALANSSLSTHQSINLLQQLPPPPAFKTFLLAFFGIRQFHLHLVVKT